MEDVLVTGSSGYIGSEVVDRLSKSNSTDLRTMDLRSHSGSSQNHIAADIQHVYNNKRDTLVHLAAFISVTESDKDATYYYDNNCAKLHQFLNNQKNDFNHVIYASSFAVYDENLEINPKSVYASTKLEGEWIVKRWAEKTGGSYSILRFANPIGINSELHSHIADRISQSYSIS